MEKSLVKKTMLRFVKMLNVLLISGAFAICWFTYYREQMEITFYNRGDWVLCLLYMFLYIMMGRIYDGFNISQYRISEMIYSQSLAATVADFLIYIVIVLLCRKMPNLFPGICCLVTQCALSVHWSLFSHWWYYRTFKPKTTIIIRDPSRDIDGLIKNYDLSKKYVIDKVIDAQDCINDLDVLKNTDSVFIGGTPSHYRNIILKYCVAHDIRVYDIPRVGDVIMSGARKVHLFHLPILMVDRYAPQPEYVIAKRLMDIIISLAGIIVLSPIMLITAICIKLCDHGPVFYRQIRLTKDGKEFKIIKFRSMRVDAEKDGTARLSSGNSDTRVTSVGRVIRKFRIDEIPQLFNILKGDLSIVGPRPERPEIHRKYCEAIPEFELRLQAKAGLTGYAQVYGQYNTKPYDKLQMDLMYIANPSILQDLKLMLMTIKILFIPESTDGIDSDKTDAL